MRRNLLILSFLLFSVSLLNGQKIKVKEPEFSGTAIFVNDTIGDGILLEHQTAVNTYCKAYFSCSCFGCFVATIPGTFF